MTTHMTEMWEPSSVTSIQDKYAFDSTTHHLDIPDNVLNSKEGVVLGVDEAGRGPVMGPMVYGVAYCLESAHESLKSYGFADSKTLKESRRQELMELIDGSGNQLYKTVGWATCTMTAKDISSGMLRSTLGAGPYNLNEQAHDTTIRLIQEVIAKGVFVKKIFVDTVGTPAVYQAKLQKYFPGAEVVVAKKADSIYPIVSTASVVAKVTRDFNLEWFHKNLSTLKGQKIGSGYPSDPFTSKWLKSNTDPVFGWLHGIVRFLWQTAKDALIANGGVNVTYEEQCAKKGYEDVGDMFGKKETYTIYGSPVIL